MHDLDIEVCQFFKQFQHLAETLPRAMHVLEWLEGLKELGEDDGKEVAIQKELVLQLKTRARTLEIAVTKGWHIGI